jgi:branched-chain amino acid transport system ATP-binding protein
MAEPVLRIEALDAHYGRAHILHGLDLHVAQSDCLVLAGRNGAGKTTTIRCVMGLLRPTRGRILFEGRDIGGWEPHRIARLGLGWVPEERRIFTDLTVAENLAVGRRGSGWTPARLFRLFPNLGPLRDRPAGRISGGEQQMLAVARTLMGNPTLLLMDEPSEGLAPLIVAQMAEAIRTLRDAGTTILLAEQNLHFARRVATGAAAILQGRIVAQGGLDDPAVRAALELAPGAAGG